RLLITIGQPPASWRGARVSYGLEYPGMITQSLPGAKPLLLPGESAAVEAVCHGEAEAAMVVRQSLTPLLLKRPQHCQSLDLRITAAAGDRVKLAGGFRFAPAAQADAHALEIRHRHA